ncbi:MAG: hypothetical protein ABIN55_11680 [Aeromicrobium sp.]
MTDPTLPVPQPEMPAEPPTRKRRFRPGKKLTIAIIVGLVLALLLGGAAYGINAKGDAEAEKYAKAIDDWNDEKNELLGVTGSANSGLWEFDQDPSKKKSLATQKVACDAVLTARKEAAKNAASLPEAPDSFFKLLSSAEREAIKTSKARVKAVKAYAKAADEVLVQMRKDCRWNLKANAAKEGDSGAKKIFDKAEKLMLKSGQSEGGYFCPNGKGDCIPATAAKRAKFAELTIKGIKVDKAYILKKFFGPGSCEATSYAELCDDLKKNLASYYGSLSSYGALFKTIGPTSSEAEEEFARMQKSNKSADKSFKKALMKAHPDFKDDFRISKYPFWREAYFSASTVDAISSLDKLKEAILKLQLEATVSV